MSAAKQVIKAGAPKGKIQSAKVKTLAANVNYKPASKVVTVKVHVK